MKNVEKALSSTEARFAQHNAKMGRLLGGRSGGGRRGPDGAKAASRDAEREAKKLAREESKLAKEQQRQSDYWAKSKLAQARLRHREEERAIKRQARLTERNLKQEHAARQQFVRSTVGNTASRVGGAVKAVGGAGLAMVGLGGAALAASSVSQAGRLDNVTRRLSIAGRAKGEKGLDSEALRKQFTQTGIASGLDPEQIASGVAAYVAKTGDLGTALKNQRTYATVAQGADADPTEVFSAAADLADKMDVKSVEDMATAFAILSAQGKKGAFELKAMAAQFPEVFSSAANAGAKGIQGVRDVGATMQLAMKATGNSSEAATAVNAMFRQLAAKAKDMQSGKAFSGRKVQVYQGGDPTKNMNNFAEVARNAISASRGDIGQLNDVFDARGRKAIDPMINAYKTAYNKAGGGKKGDEAGKDAMKGIFEEFSKVSADFSEVQRDADDAMKGFNVQMEIFNTQLKDVVASQLFPELVKLAPDLKQLLPYVSDLTKGMISLVKFFAENPFLGIGGLVGGALVAEVAKASLAQSLTSALSPAFTAAASSALKFSAAAGIAAVAVMAAVEQNDALKKETGGKGILDVAWESIVEGKDLKSIADENLDKQAKAEAAKRHIDEAKATAAAPPGATPAPVAPGTAATPARAASPVASPSLNAAAKDLSSAAASIKDASKSLAATMPNRGNAPSPVKP